MIFAVILWNSHEIIDKERETQSTFRMISHDWYNKSTDMLVSHFTALLSDENCVLKANL